MSDHTSLQPLLHSAVTCLAAPFLTLSPSDGQLRGTDAHGCFGQDRRLLHTLLLTVEGREPEPLDVHRPGPATARFTAVHRATDDPTSDPTVLIDRYRRAGHRELISVRNTGTRRRRLRVRVTAATDLTDMAAVKSGSSGCPITPEQDLSEPARVAWVAADGSRSTLTVNPEGPTPRVACGTSSAVLTWNLELAPGEDTTLDLTVTGKTSDGDHMPGAPTGPVPWTEPTLRSAPRLAELVRGGLADLTALRLVDRTAPADGAAPTDTAREDSFAGGGSPWYLTLFGRDSIWVARMLLPLGTELARGTLYALARRQGQQYDAYTEEAPGRILHELRPAESAYLGGVVLPPVYYGSIDATALFVTLLVEAWRWGLPEEDVRALLPAARRAMAWVRHTADSGDHPGLLSYRPQGAGLANQGWKDSVDAVRFADGSPATAPIALCEVQGYAYQAAIGLADLLTRFQHVKDAAELDQWAAQLRETFHARFWCEDADGPYPAMALDGAGTPVTGPTSNMGHLPATGILTPDQCHTVAERLTRPELFSGWGLRTRTSTAHGFNPLSYHGGSVWTHDTALAIDGLAQAGCVDEARMLMDALLETSTAHGHRPPELFGGDQRVPGTPHPLPYPSACRPHAWASASGVALLTARLGLRPASDGDSLTVRPLPGTAPCDVDGLRFAGCRFDVRVGTDGCTVDAPNLRVLRERDGTLRLSPPR